MQPLFLYAAQQRALIAPHPNDPTTQQRIGIPLAGLGHDVSLAPDASPMLGEETHHEYERAGDPPVRSVRIVRGWKIDLVAMMRLPRYGEQRQESPLDIHRAAKATRR